MMKIKIRNFEKKTICEVGVSVSLKCRLILAGKDRSNVLVSRRLVGEIIWSFFFPDELELWEEAEEFKLKQKVREQSCFVTHRYMLDVSTRSADTLLNLCTRPVVIESICYRTTEKRHHSQLKAGRARFHAVPTHVGTSNHKLTLIEPFNCNESETLLPVMKKGTAMMINSIKCNNAIIKLPLPNTLLISEKMT